MRQQGFTLYQLLVTIAVIFGIGGWIANIVKIAGVVGAEFVLTGMMILRVVGIFVFPLGAVMGYL